MLLLLSCILWWTTGPRLLFSIQLTTTTTCTSFCTTIHKKRQSFQPFPLVLQCLNNHVYNVKLVPQDMTRLSETHDSIVDERTHHHHVQKPALLANDNHETDECIPMEPWQEDHHVTCNVFHEVDLRELRNQPNLQIVGSGFYRSIWRVDDNVHGNVVALKTLRLVDRKQHSGVHRKVGYQVDFIPSTIQQQRTDAVVMEQLQSSPYISDIYGYCSTSALTEFSENGNLQSALRDSHLDKYTRLKMALDVAQAVADVHHPTTQANMATIVHSDLNPNQFLKMGNVYKLNDFNRAKFILKNTTLDDHDAPCGIQTHMNWRATYQAPEEYSEKFQTEKVDVFTMGLVLYKIWLNEDLYPGMSPTRRREFVVNGGHAKIPSLHSQHALDVIMPIVLKKCWMTDPKKRASAQEIANLLHEALKELE